MQNNLKKIKSKIYLIPKIRSPLDFQIQRVAKGY